MLRLCLPDLLLNGLVAVTVVPLLAVGEEPVDDDAADGEDEDEDRPQELVADRAAGLEELDYARVSTLYMGKMRYGHTYSRQEYRELIPRTQRLRRLLHTGCLSSLL